MQYGAGSAIIFRIIASSFEPHSQLYIATSFCVRSDIFLGISTWTARWKHNAQPDKATGNTNRYLSPCSLAYGPQLTSQLLFVCLLHVIGELMAAADTRAPQLSLENYLHQIRSCYNEHHKVCAASHHRVGKQQVYIALLHHDRCMRLG